MRRKPIKIISLVLTIFSSVVLTIIIPNFFVLKSVNGFTEWMSMYEKIQIKRLLMLWCILLIQLSCGCIAMNSIDIVLDKKRNLKNIFSRNLLPVNIILLITSFVFLILISICVKTELTIFMI